MPFGLGKKKDKKKEEWLKKLGISDNDFRKLSATEAILKGYETHKKIAALTGLDAEKIDKVRRDGSYVSTQDRIFYRMAVDSKNPHNAFFIFFTEMLMPAAAELLEKYHPIVGKRVAKAVESLIRGDPNATFDKILDLEDRKIAQVVGRHIEDIRGKPLTNEEWQRLEKIVTAIKKISAKVYSNGLQAPEALYRGAKRNDFDKALVEEGILDEEDVAMIKQVFAEISGKKAEKKPERQKSQSSLSSEARELLGLLRGLKFARYSDDAVSEAKRELKAKLNELLQRPEKNLELMGLYFAVGELIERGDFEKAEELLRKLG